ncbi:MAG: hypothetical protein ACK4MR_03170 [Erythrobacter cryptus]
MRPLVDVIESHLREMAGEVLASYGALTALGSAGGFDSERSRAKRAVEGIVGDLGLLPPLQTIGVAPEIVAVLGELEGKSPLARYSLAPMVPAP